MRRYTIALLITLAFGLLLAPLRADAQPPHAKVVRVGILAPTPPSPLFEAFRQALRKLGYVEGQNLALEYRFAPGRFDLLPALAAELVRLPVDLIVTESTPAAHAAKQATSTLPIVMTTSSDPVGSGLVASLARPGGTSPG